MDVKKIVRCLPEQYQELLETGQVEVDGKIKTKEDGVVYDTGYLEFIEWHNKFMQAQYEQVKVNHTPMAMKSLEQEYEELTADEGGKESAYVSAVGFTAVLKGGDTIRTGAPNSGCFFINGERLTHDYTYNGDGYEVVNVWVFEGKPEAGNPIIVPPQLNDTPTFNITELDMRNIAQTPVVGDSYKNYALTLKAYNFVISGLATRKLVSNGTDAFNQSSVASTVEEAESDCVTINSSALANKTNLKSVSLPNLEIIVGKQNGFLFNCSNPELKMHFPKLKVINGWNITQTPFNGVENVVIPTSVKQMLRVVCSGNKTITLNCNRADNIAPEWCYNTPSVNFDMCGDWYPSINIAVAAKNHAKDWFIDLFRNKLYDHSITTDTGDGGMIVSAGEITIPLAIFNAHTDDELAIAENKNWTVGGA